eukprot:573734-Hanusia_phi.AAC.2
MVDDSEGAQGERMSLSASSRHEGKLRRKGRQKAMTRYMQQGVESENIRRAFADVVIEKITSEKGSRRATGLRSGPPPPQSLTSSLVDRSSHQAFHRHLSSRPPGHSCSSLVLLKSRSYGMKLLARLLLTSPTREYNSRGSRSLPLLLSLLLVTIHTAWRSIKRATSSLSRTSSSPSGSCDLCSSLVSSLFSLGFSYLISPSSLSPDSHAAQARRWAPAGSLGEGDDE